MALWIEIHCDVGRMDHPTCRTFKGDNPGVLTNSDRQSMMDGLYSLERLARKHGWWKHPRTGRWECPSCHLRAELSAIKSV